MKEGKFIGGGRDKEVYENAHNPEQIIKRYTAEVASAHKAVARGYLGKILHILLPKNMPAMHISSSSPNQVVMERKDISADADHTMIMRASSGLDKGTQALHMDAARRTKRHADPAVVEIKNKLLELGIEPDTSAQNFAKDELGEMIYVDNVEPWTGIWADPESEDPKWRLPLLSNFDEEKLAKAIHQIPDKITRKSAEIYLTRLVSLFKEECELVNKARNA